MATGEEFRKLSYPSILRSEIHLSAGKILSFRDICEMIRIKFRGVARISRRGGFQIGSNENGWSKILSVTYVQYFGVYATQTVMDCFVSIFLVLENCWIRQMMRKIYYVFG